MTGLDFVKTYEKLLIAVLLTIVIGFVGSKGVDAWVNHDKAALVAAQQQIDVLHEDNARVHDDNLILQNQLSVLKQQVEANSVKSDKIIAQLRKKTSDQQTVDMQLPPLQLAERWTVLLDLPANSVTPAPDKKYLLTDEAARATVVQLEQVAPLVEENIQLVAQLAGEKQIVANHYALINPSQEHCQAEVKAALPMLHSGSLVLIDDAGLPGGGKARLAKKLLAESGWECLADEYQTLWSKP